MVQWQKMRCRRSRTGNMKKSFIGRLSTSAWLSVDIEGPGLGSPRICRIKRHQTDLQNDQPRDATILIVGGKICNSTSKTVAQVDGNKDGPKWRSKPPTRKNSHSQACPCLERTLKAHSKFWPLLTGRLRFFSWPLFPKRRLLQMKDTEPCRFARGFSGNFLALKLLGGDNDTASAVPILLNGRLVGTRANPVSFSRHSCTHKVASIRRSPAFLQGLFCNLQRLQ